MDPINSLTHITQLLRKKLSEKPELTKSKIRRESGNVDKQVSSGKQSVEDIKGVIRTRILALDPNERSGKKAALVFIESILAWEFGEEVLDDPKFSEISKEVQIAVTENPDVWNNFQVMLKSI